MKRDPKNNAFETNKASFKIFKNKILIKEYYRERDLKHAFDEFKLLKLIEDYYKIQEINNWTYRPLKVFKFFSNSTIFMEFVSSVTIREHFAKNKRVEIYNHMGVWLSLLHLSTQHKKTQFPLSFEDYSDTNFLIDWKNNEIIAIDPGGHESLYSHPSVSIVSGAFSIQRGVLKHSKSFIKAIAANYYYINGYLTASGEYKLPKLSKGLNYICRRQNILWFGRKIPFDYNFIRTIEFISLLIQLKTISTIMHLKSLFQMNQ